MTVLAITTWHSRPDLLVEQLLNYNAAFEGEVVHVVNINANFKEPFFKEAEKRGIDWSKISNLIFVPEPAKTGLMNIFPGYLKSLHHALQIRLDFDYVYFHTSADLLVKKGISGYIKGFDIGFMKSSGSDFDFFYDDDNNKLVNYMPNGVDNFFTGPVGLDKKFADFLEINSLNKVNKTRSEGCFFKREILFELLFPVFMVYSMRDFEAGPYPRFPPEEFHLSSCVEAYCANNSGLKRARHVVLTSPNEDNRASIEDIEKVVDAPNLFGIKRFAHEIDDPMRQHVRRIMQLG